jgi:hypothetical protein
VLEAVLVFHSRQRKEFFSTCFERPAPRLSTQLLPLRATHRMHDSPTESRQHAVVLRRHTEVGEEAVDGLYE